MQLEASLISLKEKYENKWWRLNNLYWIIDKQGQKVPFRCNWAQENLFDNMWHFNIILKARQLGFTTFVDIYYLDECLFNDNIEAGIIAHNKEDAQKIFRRKVQFPYRNLPEPLQKARKDVTDARSELAFNNGSVIYVGTSMRSGTLQYLHISEHGKICRKYPEKAEEIKTGAINAIEAGQMIFIESTAEGISGDFFEMCQKAREQVENKHQLSELDFKFHFYPWFQNPDYRISPEGITIPDESTMYFNNIERSLDIKLDEAQRAWYFKKSQTMGFKMKQEYPATPQEAFESTGQAFAFSKDHHVLEKPIPIPEAAQIYMTFDWGFGAPYSVGYWWVDSEGRVYRFSEIYGCTRMPNEPISGLRQTDPEIAEAINEHEKKIGLWGRRKDIIRFCDPTCRNKKPDYKGGGQGPSTVEEFAKKGIYLIPGDANRGLKIRQFQTRLRLFDDMAPMMMIYPGCKDFIRTIPTLKVDENNIEDIDTTGEDHCYDEAALICMARPLAMAEPEEKLSSYDKRIERLKGGDKDSYTEYAEREQLDTMRDFERDYEFGDVDEYEDGGDDGSLVGTAD